MTVPPAGQSCSTCTNYYNNECHYGSPSTTIGWTPVRPDDWCSCWCLTGTEGAKGDKGDTGSPQSLETASLDLYVSTTTGYDTGPGTLEFPFKTIMKAVNTIAVKRFQFDSYWPTIHVIDAGTYDETVSLPRILGTSYPCLFSENGRAKITGGIYMWDSGDWTIDGFEISLRSKSINYGLNAYINYHSNLVLSDTQFHGTVDKHVAVDGWSHLYAASWSVHTGAKVFLSVSRYSMADSHNCYFVDNPAFTEYVLEAYDHSILDWSDGNEPEMGACTGPAVRLRTCSMLMSEPANYTSTRSTLPGNSLGIKDVTSSIEHDPVYNIAAPTTGQTVTMAPGLKQQVINPAGALDALTVNLPTLMFDGETVDISTSQTITALTIATTDSSTVVGAPSSLSASNHVRFIYKSSNTTWYIA